MAFRIAEAFIDVSVKTGKSLAAIGALGSSLNTVAALGTAAAQMVGGGLAIAPALLAAVGGAAATAKLGVQGFSDAIGNMSDPEAFAESLEALAPAARETALAMKALQPAWSGMQQTVQQNLFAGLGEQMSALGNSYIPLLQTGLGGIATEMNGMAVSASKALMEPTTVASVTAALGGTKSMLAGMKDSVGDVVAGLLNMAGVGSTHLGGMGTAIGNATAKFKEWTVSTAGQEQINNMILLGKQALIDVGAVLGNLGSAFSGIFTAMQSAGTGTMQVLITLTDTLSSMINSVAGQTALTTFFSALSTVATQLGQVFMGLMPIIGPVIEIISMLATTIGGMLVTAVNTLGPPLGLLVSGLRDALAPVLPVIEGAFTTLVSALGPLVSALVGALVPAMNVLAPILGQIATVVGGALAAGFNAITPVITQLAPLFAQIAEQVGGLLLQAVQALAPLIPVLAAAFMKIVAAVMPLIPPLLNLASQILPMFADAITGFIIPAINFLLPIIVGLITAFVRIVSTVANVAARVIAFVNNIRAAVFGAFNAMGQVVNNVMNGISNFINSAVNRIRGIFQWFGQLPGMLGGYFRSAASAVSSAIGGLISTVSSIPGRIRSAIGNLGGMLVGAGRSLITGLINGIKGAIGGAISAVKGAISSIRNLFPFSPAKEGPFSGRGYTTYSGAALATDFADSISGKTSMVRDAAQGLMKAASGDIRMGGGLSVTPGAGIRPTAGAGTVTNIFHVSIDGKSVAEMQNIANFFDRVQQTARRGSNSIAGVRA